MNRAHYILVVLMILYFQSGAQNHDSFDYRWGNGFYYNMDLGETVVFNEVEMTLLNINNHYNQLKIGEDTLWLKVARRSLPETVSGVRIFVADNKNVKALASNPSAHGLLTGDALVCLSDFSKPLLDPFQYSFPVSFKDGFFWNAEENSHIFSYYKSGELNEPDNFYSYPGIGIDLQNTRGHSGHWLVAVEESRVVWIGASRSEDAATLSCLLLESGSQKDIYYLYCGLSPENILVKRGQKLQFEQPVGIARGDSRRNSLHFAVIHSASEPAIEECFSNIVNGFPQLYDLCFPDDRSRERYFSRGRITFGFPQHISGNRLNVGSFERYLGKGWVLGPWNTADKVEWITNGKEGNARLQKVMFRETPARCENPLSYFEYRITVSNGTYRIRAKAGDLFQPSWQKIEFNDVYGGTKVLGAGETDWTNERVVRVRDGILLVRIYTDPENRRVAGLSEIVFQQAIVNP